MPSKSTIGARRPSKAWVKALGDDIPPIALAFKGWRNRKGLSQPQAAEALGIPLATLHDIEQSGRAPTTHVANAAGVIILALLEE